MLTYSPENPVCYVRYHPAGLRGALRSGGGEDTRLPYLVQEPASRAPRLLTDIAPRHHAGLVTAAAEIGGVAAYIYLLAKVIAWRHKHGITDKYGCPFDLSILVSKICFIHFSSLSVFLHAQKPPPHDCVCL